MKMCVVLIIFTEESDGEMKWTLVLALSLNSVLLINSRTNFFLILVYSYVKDRIKERLDNTKDVKDHHYNGNSTHLVYSI